GRLGRDRRRPRRLVEQADLAEHLVRAELTQDALVPGSVDLAGAETRRLDDEEPVGCVPLPDDDLAGHDLDRPDVAQGGLEPRRRNAGEEWQRGRPGNARLHT